MATVLPNIESAHAVTDVVAGQHLEYRHLLQRPDLKPIWEQAFSNALGRLAQGIRNVKGTDTIAFVFASEVPRYVKVTYGRLVCDIRTQKTEQHRVRLTIGGDRIDYPGEMATKMLTEPHPNVCGTSSFIQIMPCTCAPTKKNLPQHNAGKAGVYALGPRHHSTGNNRQIQLVRKG
jgi:hypothetical protein